MYSAHTAQYQCGRPPACIGAPTRPLEQTWCGDDTAQTAGPGRVIRSVQPTPKSWSSLARASTICARGPSVSSSRVVDCRRAPLQMARQSRVTPTAWRYLCAHRILRVCTQVALCRVAASAAVYLDKKFLRIGGRVGRFPSLDWTTFIYPGLYLY